MFKYLDEVIKEETVLYKLLLRMPQDMNIEMRSIEKVTQLYWTT